MIKKTSLGANPTFLSSDFIRSVIGHTTSLNELGLSLTGFLYLSELLGKHCDKCFMCRCTCQLHTGGINLNCNLIETVRFNLMC